MINTYIKNALSKKFTTAYVWFLGCLLLFMSHIHFSNLLGWNGQPWLTFPLLWQLMDLALLGFELYVAIGLIYRKVKAVIVFYSGLIILQIIPFTVFRSYFIEKPQDADLLNSLLLIELSVLVIFTILILVQGRTPVFDENPG